MNIKAVLSGLMLGFLSLIPLAPFAEEGMQVQDSSIADSVDYISGGIGETELEMMQGRAKDFPLELVFVQKSKQKEEYLADINVKIQDAHQNVILETVTEGPYLFVKLPQGRYMITAVYNKDEKVKYARVNSRKHQKIVFWWPLLGPTEFEMQLNEE